MLNALEIKIYRNFKMEEALRKKQSRLKFVVSRTSETFRIKNTVLLGNSFKRLIFWGVV